MGYTASKLEELSSTAVGLNNALNAFFNWVRELNAPNNKAIDLTVILPNYGRSIADIEERCIAAVRLAQSITPRDLIAPDRLIEAVSSSMSGISNLLTQLDKIKSQSSNAFLRTSDFHLLNGQGNVIRNLRDDLVNLDAGTDKLLLQLYSLIAVIRSRSVPALSELIKGLSEEKTQIKESVDQIKSLARTATTNLASLQNFLKEAGEKNSEIGRILEQSTNSRKNILEYEGEVNPKVASIREVSNQAASLKELIEKHKSEFDAFQASLDDRNKQFEVGSAKLERLTVELNESSEEISRLNRQASEMLQGATVAGLAGEFGASRNMLQKEVSRARNSFYFAMFFLFVSALPLAFYVFPLESLPQILSGDWHLLEAGAVTFSGVLARLILLLPAAWFAKFAAARHAALFRLKEHYAYKHSIAAAVEGFKKQAPTYEDEIAAFTFHELTFNPADRMEARGNPERAPNPAYEEDASHS